MRPPQKISTIFWPFLAIFTLFHLKNWPYLQKPEFRILAKTRFWLLLVNNSLCSIPLSYARSYIKETPGDRCETSCYQPIPQKINLFQLPRLFTKILRPWSLLFKRLLPHILVLGRPCLTLQTQWLSSGSKYAYPCLGKVYFFNSYDLMPTYCSQKKMSFLKILHKKICSSWEV